MYVWECLQLGSAAVPCCNRSICRSRQSRLSSCNLSPLVQDVVVVGRFYSKSVGRSGALRRLPLRRHWSVPMPKLARPCQEPCTTFLATLLYTHTHTHIYIYIYIYTHIGVHIYIYICVYINMYMSTLLHCRSSTKCNSGTVPSVYCQTDRDGTISSAFV